ncbi:hypothetical protein EH223_17120 [candidate division KSB1 bacterium]|nr:hypothetical protein [candidate division KSB1 bacterium]RQW00872.1 MAG: hypothetical protein EH223_17120 [candidate division KSB1 bacterium]
MAEKFQSLLPMLKERFEKELVREIGSDTNQLIGVPDPYITPGTEKQDALFYWDTYFINLGLIRLKLIDLARYNAENLIFLQRKFGYVPAANLKSYSRLSTLPLLPWIVRDIYRATGDKDWLSRMLPDVINEYHFWTTKPHTTSVGLYRFTNTAKKDTTPDVLGSCWVRSIRFDKDENYNPVDLNALLYRNAILIHDLQIEADGKGDQSLLHKSDHIKKMFTLFWDEDSHFYFDNNFAEKRLNQIKTLAGFMPLFVELVDEQQADALQSHLKDFVAPGGITITDKEYTINGMSWSYPLLCAPFLYFVIKGLSDYEFMEDAADIGTNWLSMVFDIYQQTGNMWEWYNVNDKSITSPKGVPNTPILGWTAGTYIALLDTLGLG